MRIYAKNIPAKYHPDPIWNDVALGFMKKLCQEEEEQQQPARALPVNCKAYVLYQPATRINFQSKALSIVAPAVWNSLSSVTKSSATVTTFKAHLTRQLSYRKEDRAMGPIYGCTEKFW